MNAPTMLVITLATTMAVAGFAVATVMYIANQRKPRHSTTCMWCGGSGRCRERMDRDDGLVNLVPARMHDRKSITCPWCRGSGQNPTHDYLREKYEL